LIDRLKPEGGPRRTPGPAGAASELGPLVLAVFGPTASGKTAVAEALAERVPAEPVSADSMQVYRGLPILTNQPERPTRLVGIWPLDHEGSVAEYGRLAHAAVDEILAAGRTPVVAGGTGLYLRAALAELDVPPAPRAEARARWERLYDRLGAERAHAMLAERDVTAATAVHPNDRRRVVRALELAEAGSSLAPAESRLWTAELRRPGLVFGLDVTPEVLAERIERRAQEMYERGVEEEVRRALAHPISDTARQVIGLHEVATLPREEATAALTSRTRQYAAYQRKWMRRIPGIVSLAADRPPGDVADEILEVARARQRLPARRAD
jgi:tRNA dimethylallyltransferase